MIEDRARLRLQFLDRVVQRECAQLQRTTKRLFAEPFTLEKAKTLTEDDAFSERVEAFVSRFSRLQDTLGDKLMPLVLSMLGEQQLANIDVLDKAERLGWVDSSDEWYAIRQLRNQMVHEYIEDLAILTSAIQAAQLFVSTLTSAAEKLHTETQRRGWL